MSTQNYFILTSAQRTEVMVFNAGSSYTIDPRAIDASSPGVGLNLNANATDIAAGAAVPLTGKFVAPVRIVNDPSYIASVPGMISYLNALPCAILENETIFAPVPE